MQKQTRERLQNVGWHQGRIIDVYFIKNKYKEIGLEMPTCVEIFLREYGMLKIDAPDKRYYDVEFNPLKAIGKNLNADYFRECLKEFGVSDMVYPIGIACRENLSVLMTVQNEFYCFTDGCLIKAGNDIEEMLDCLVGECREAENYEVKGAQIHGKLYYNTCICG